MPLFLRRRAAGAYLRERYGFCSEKMLSKLAVQGGGPEMRYAGGLPLYTKRALDDWALSKIGPPVSLTSERLVRERTKPTPVLVGSSR